MADVTEVLVERHPIDGPEFVMRVSSHDSVDDAQVSALLHERMVIGLGAHDGHSRVAIKSWRNGECVFYGPPRGSLLAVERRRDG